MPSSSSKPSQPFWRGCASGLVWRVVNPCLGSSGAGRSHAPFARWRSVQHYGSRKPTRAVSCRLFSGGAAGFEAGLEKKRRKEWARQAPWLAERGRLQARLVEGAEGIERFLALEAKGWKGARGTALGADRGRRAFARATLVAFAERGRLQIHELALDQSPIAIGVVLRAGARAFDWKTAYDEGFGEFSPGVQLTLALSRRLQRGAGPRARRFSRVPAGPSHDRPDWPGRIELVDLVLAAEEERAWRLGAWLAVERASSALRERVKRIANRLRGRKRS